MQDKMQAPTKPWEGHSLQNSAQILKNENQTCGGGGSIRNTPVLPPRPQNLLTNGYNSYSPYSSKYS